MRILIVLAFALSAFAADAPKITIEMRAKFWRSQAEAIAATAQAEKAQAHASSVRAELAKACGDQPLIAGPDGEPTCQPKPEPAKPQAP